MLETCTAAHFEPHNGDIFTVSSCEPSVDLILVEVTRRGMGERAEGAFALLWQGPTEPLLDQGSHSLEHPTLGKLDIFIVPVAEKDAGIQYEAIFT